LDKQNIKILEDIAYKKKRAEEEHAAKELERLKAEDEA